MESGQRGARGTRGCCWFALFWSFCFCCEFQFFASRPIVEKLKTYEKFEEKVMKLGIIYMLVFPGYVSYSKYSTM